METDPILLIDPDTVLPAPITAESLQSVSRRNRELPEFANAVDLIQLSPGNRPQGLGTALASRSRIDAVKDVPCALVPKCPNHGSCYNG